MSCFVNHEPNAPWKKYIVDWTLFDKCQKMFSKVSSVTLIINELPLTSNMVHLKIKCLEFWSSKRAFK